MNPGNLSALHAFTLVLMGFWGYYATQSPTAFIPVILGCLLLVMNKGVRAESKVQAHIAVVITLLAILGIAKPFMSAMDDGDAMGMFRTGAMIVTGVLAFISFIQSFIAARKNKNTKI